MQRMKAMLDPFEDSEDEDKLLGDPGAFRERGFGGLVQLETEEDDFGEEMSAFAASFRRMGRRLERWDREQQFGRNLGVMGTNRVPQPNAASPMSLDNDETEDEKPAGYRSRPVVLPPIETLRGSQPVGRTEEEEDLDDMEKEILGLGSEAEEAEEDIDEDLNDIDKALLGMRGDETEDEDNDDWSVGPSVSVRA
jgi:Ino eighty subunit 1